MALKAVPGQQRSLVPTTTTPTSPQSRLSSAQGQGTLPGPLPTIIMWVPGEGRGPNPCDSHPQKPVSLISCTLRSSPGYLLTPVRAPHPGDSHACSRSPCMSPQTCLCLNRAQPHLPVPPTQAPPVACHAPRQDLSPQQHAAPGSGEAQRQAHGARPEEGSEGGGHDPGSTTVAGSALGEKAGGCNRAEEQRRPGSTTQRRATGTQVRPGSTQGPGGMA